MNFFSLRFPKLIFLIIFVYDKFQCFISIVALHPHDRKIFMTSLMCCLQIGQRAPRSFFTAMAHSKHMHM